MTDWISVEDRLPERDGIYICLADGEQWICDFLSDRGWFAGENHLPVTHWKPAPIRQHD